MTDYGKNICEAIDTIVNKKLTTVACDVTESAVIVGANENWYDVQNQLGTFKAFSKRYYKAGDTVYVLVPKGDWGQQKFIIGPKIDENDVGPTLSLLSLDTVEENETITYFPHPDIYTLLDFDKSQLVELSDYKNIICSFENSGNNNIQLALILNEQKRFEQQCSNNSKVTIKFKLNIDFLLKSLKVILSDIANISNLEVKLERKEDANGNIISANNG